MQWIIKEGLWFFEAVLKPIWWLFGHQKVLFLKKCCKPSVTGKASPSISKARVAFFSFLARSTRAIFIHLRNEELLKEEGEVQETAPFSGKCMTKHLSCGRDVTFISPFLLQMLNVDASTTSWTCWRAYTWWAAWPRTDTCGTGDTISPKPCRLWKKREKRTSTHNKFSWSRKESMSMNLISTVKEMKKWQDVLAQVTIQKYLSSSSQEWNFVLVIIFYNAKNNMRLCRSIPMSLEKKHLLDSFFLKCYCLRGTRTLWWEQALHALSVLLLVQFLLVCFGFTVQEQGGVRGNYQTCPICRICYHWAW